MTYADIIREALAIWPGTQDKFAEKIGVGKNHLSSILNGKVGGSPKSALAALLTREPMPENTTSDEQLLIHKLLFILRNDPKGAGGIKVNIDYFYEQSRREVRKNKTTTDPGSHSSNGQVPGKTGDQPPPKEAKQRRA